MAGFGKAPWVWYGVEERERMFSLLKADRRTILAQQAARARDKWANRQMALIILIIYNIVGLADILSTHMAIASGNGEEANPFIRAAMEDLSWEKAWIMIKLSLQFAVTGMILWFPSRLVLAIFAAVVVMMSAVAISNFMIADVL